MFKRSFALLGAVCLAAVMAAAPAYAQRTKLTLYTAIENDQLGPFKQTIEARCPRRRDRVGTRFHRRHHGALPRREDNPRADVVFGLAVTSLILFEKQACWRLTSRRVRRPEATVP